MDSIRAGLDSAVVGQAEGKQLVAQLLAMHLALQQDGSSGKTPNALVMGPTGVGKTHTLRAAAALAAVPVVVVDATSLVQSGVVGLQVEDVIESLVAASRDMLDRVGRRTGRDDDLALAGRGVVVVDEFDKLRASLDDLSRDQRDKLVIQRRLLKFAEGAPIRVGVKYHRDDDHDRYLDTSKILLVASGAFSDRGGVRRGANEIESDVTPFGIDPSDLIDFGFLPELVGRFPVVISFRDLTADDLAAILDREDVSPLTIWRRYFRAIFGVELVVEDAAKRIAAERAAALGLGARGLERVLFPVLTRVATRMREGTSVCALTVADLLPMGRPSSERSH